MDGNNWRAAQAQISIPGQSMNSEVAGVPAIEIGDWRTQLQADSRHRIVSKIMETLKKHLPFSGQEGLQELQKIAIRFEEKIFTAASSQADYLKRISLKMLTMETKSATNSKNPQDPASQPMQSQMQNQVQPISMPMVANQPQGRQPLLSQNIQSGLTSAGAPSSAAFASVHPGGMSQSGIMPNTSGQNPNIQNIQNMPTVTPSAVGNSMGQGLPSNIFANSQRVGRQQQIVQQEQPQQQQQQQQSQNSTQHPYNQLRQQQLMKQKLQQGTIPQSLLQSQMQQQQQQQNILQPNQLQASQQAVMQSSLRQSSSSSAVQKNQQPSLQQSTQSILQQQSQSVLRQQPPIMNQQQTSLPHHSALPTQQQQPQQISGHQSNTSNMQLNQMIDQQSNVLEPQQQQQRMMTQQNSISNLQQQQTINHQNNVSNMHQQLSSGPQNSLQTVHQQQLGSQTNISGFQPQQMVGMQHVSSSLQPNQQPVHMLQQSKVPAHLQMQNMESLLPNQVHQSQSQSHSHSQPSQQQLMSQIQSQSSHLQQNSSLQQQTNSLQRDMQQGIQTSGPSHQTHTTVDQQKQLLQSQRVISEVPPNSSSHSNGGDWQEEIYQKIKAMNEMYFMELNEIYQRMATKLQQLDSLTQQPKHEQHDKARMYMSSLERFLMFLRISKNEIQPNHKEKIAVVEKQISTIINSNRSRRPISSLQQGQLPQPHMHAMPQSQQPQSQISQMSTVDNQLNSQMQPTGQTSVATTQQNNLNSLHHHSISSNVSNSRQKMMDALQLGSNAEPGQGNSNSLNSMQQLSMSSIQQNPVSGPQQMNVNSVASQSGLTTLQSNINPLQSNSNVLQIKPEQQMFSTQQLKHQFQQRHMHQQYAQRQQLIQQQQQQTSQQTSTQLTAQQMMQLNQISDSNDIKMRQQINNKPGVLQQQNSGQRPSYPPQIKSGTLFSISSPQVLQVPSPQISHHPSPQLEQQNMAVSHVKVNSPFVIPSPSTSMAPSPIPGDSEKINSGVTSLLNTGNHHSTVGASGPTQSLAIGTPGISASPLLAEFTSPDGVNGAASTVVSGNVNVVEKPFERLMKVVKSMSPKALSAAVSDISSVVSMVDRIAGSAPGNGSRAAVGEDLVAMTKCSLQARNVLSRDGSSGTRKMRRYLSAMPSNVLLSTGSMSNGPKNVNSSESDGESIVVSSIKRPRIEQANQAFEEELREINQRLIDTVVSISEDDVDPTAFAAAAEGKEGTIVKCSFTAVALSPNLKSQYTSAQMSPIQPLKLLIPIDYPNCSPILLDTFPTEVSKEHEDLSMKAKSRFSISLRTLAQPMSLGDIARTWDVCARAVISEYAQQSGGGSFSSKYGTWETYNYLSAT